MKYIDLSVKINQHTPVVPGDPSVSITKLLDVEKEGANVHEVHVGTHVGTHIDAPSHMILHAKNLDAFTPESFIGNGVLVPVEQSFTTDIFKNIQISRGDIVLFFTNMMKTYFQPEYYTAYPSITEEVADFLIAKGVKMVGMDMSGPDYDPYPIHKKLLEHNILIIENLTNLDMLQDKAFTVYAFPLKLDLDGSPARVIAEILD